MATNLSLRSLLDSDKLMGPNFDSWYRKLKIILEYERILYVIIDPIPMEPDLNVCSSIRDTYQKWLNDQTTIRYIMLEGMKDELSHRFESTQLEEIIQVLSDSFGIPDDIERYKTSCAIFNAWMRE